MSADGHWWWDGRAWVPTELATQQMQMAQWAQYAQPTVEWGDNPYAVRHAGPPAYPGGPGVALRTSGFAVASLVLSIVWLAGFGSLLGAIFGVVALREIRRAPGQVRGQGLALAGLVIGVLGLALTSVAIATSSSTGVRTESGRSNPESVRNAYTKQHLYLAAAAEEEFHSRNRTYTTSIVDLEHAGWRVPEITTVTIVSADREAYCLSAQSNEGGLIYYLDSHTDTASTAACT
jgi:hypothetical protein